MQKRKDKSFMFAIGALDFEEVKEWVAEYPDLINLRWAEDHPLERAIHTANPEMLKLLIRLGSDPNAKSESNQISILHHACLYGKAQMVRALIHEGAHVEATDKHGRRPLHFAAQNLATESVEIIQILIDHGADITALDIRGNGLLQHTKQFADETGNVETLNFVEGLWQSHQEKRVLSEALRAIPTSEESVEQKGARGILRM